MWIFCCFQSLLFQESFCDLSLPQMSWHRLSVAMSFGSIHQRWRSDDMTIGGPTSLPEDPCVSLPLEESVRLTDEQSTSWVELAPSVAPTRPDAPLLIFLPVAVARVRLVAFDIVVDNHDESDIDVSSVQAQV